LAIPALLSLPLGNPAQKYKAVGNITYANIRGKKLLKINTKINGFIAV
jgi:hypothetical protein